MLSIDLFFSLSLPVVLNVFIIGHFCHFRVSGIDTEHPGMWMVLSEKHMGQERNFDTKECHARPEALV